MANIAGRVAMKVMTVVLGIPVGIVTKKVVEKAWDATHPDDPPRRPNEAGVHWRDALAWGALSAAGVVAADLITRRSAESAWRVLIGTEPPPPKTTRAEKNLEQAQQRSGPVGRDS
jgi:hypothetical protein